MLPFRQRKYRMRNAFTYAQMGSLFAHVVVYTNEEIVLFFSFALDNHLERYLTN